MGWRDLFAPGRGPRSGKVSARVEPSSVRSVADPLVRLKRVVTADGVRYVDAPDSPPRPVVSDRLPPAPPRTRGTVRDPDRHRMNQSLEPPWDYEAWRF